MLGIGYVDSDTIVRNTANAWTAKYVSTLKILEIRTGMDDADGFTVQDRDRRLTGQLRGQSDNPIAPPSFAINSEWKVGSSVISHREAVTDSSTVGETDDMTG